MKLLKNRYIKIGKETFVLRDSLRAMIEYESLSGQKFEDIEEAGIKAQIMYMYCAIVEGMNHENRKFNLTFEQFFEFVNNYTLEESEKETAVKKKE